MPIMLSMNQFNLSLVHGTVMLAELIVLLLSDEVIYNYGANTESLLSNIVLLTDALLCKDCNCTK